MDEYLQKMRVLMQSTNLVVESWKGSQNYSVWDMDQIKLRDNSRRKAQSRRHEDQGSNCKKRDIK